MVYEINDIEKPRLDAAEGLNNGYYETEEICVDSNGKRYNVQIYLAQESHIDNSILPYDWYKQYIVSGERLNGLPTEYVAQLESLSCVLDPDFQRRPKHLKV